MNRRLFSAHLGALISATCIVVACTSSVGVATTSNTLTDSGVVPNGDTSVPPLDIGQPLVDANFYSADASAADAGPLLPTDLAIAVKRMQDATAGRASRNCGCYRDGLESWDDAPSCAAWYTADPTDLRCMVDMFAAPGRDKAVDLTFADCIADLYETFNSCFDAKANCEGAGNGCFTQALRATRTACRNSFFGDVPSGALNAGLEAENICRYGARQACPTSVSSAVGTAVFAGSFVGQGDDFRTAGTCTDGYADQAPIQTFTGADVAYLWKPPSDGVYVFDSSGSRANVLLSVRTGCAETAPVLGCGLSGSSVTSPPARYKRARMTAELRADTTYTVVVDTIGRLAFNKGEYAVNIYKLSDTVKRTTDVVSTALTLNLAARTGVAAVTVLVPAAGTDVLLEVGNLTVDSVSLGGVALAPSYVFDDMGRRQLRVATTAGSRVVTVNYHFASRVSLEGFNADKGWSYLWPNFCGNLFPCESDTTDGSKFTINVTGVPAGATAIYSSNTLNDAPSYMAAVAIGNYTQLPLGVTTAGTSVSSWYLPGDLANATAGSAHLRAAFDRAERTYGTYRFGSSVGTVSVARGGGGMEHHPFWHIGQDQLADEKVNVHEAMHGWYGNGVRMACWEDFVLSEGTTEYLTWRTLELEGVDIRARLECELKNACTDANTIAYPTGCNAFDINYSALWSSIPYKKGAFFYRRVGEVIGLVALDGILRDFYAANAGQAKHMQDMVDYMVSRATAAQATQIRALAQSWLRDLACPAEVASLTCP